MDIVSSGGTLFAGEQGGTRIPVRVLGVRGVPLETLLEILSGTPVLSPHTSPISIPQERRISLFPLLWLFFFLSLSGGGLIWFGVPRTLSLFSSPVYHRTLPVSGNRIASLPSGSENEGMVKDASNVQLPTADYAVLASLAGNRVVIPSLNLSLPLVRAATLEEDALVEALSHGVTLYPNGVDPGSTGNVVVTAHSSGEPWKGPYRFAFLYIHKLKPGDVIYVDYGPQRYTYEVTGQRVINPRETPHIPSEASSARLTLSTCWPIWTTDQRLLVEAALLRSDPVPALLYSET